MFDVSFNTRPLDLALDGLGDTLARPAAFIERRAGDWLAEVEREQFATGGRAGASGQWRPLAHATTRRRSLEARGYKLLADTGRMRDELTQAVNLRRHMAMTGDVIVFRLPSPAGLHQRGTRRMPARKVVDASAVQVRRLEEAGAKEGRDVGRRLGFEVKP